MEVIPQTSMSQPTSYTENGLTTAKFLIGLRKETCPEWSTLEVLNANGYSPACSMPMMMKMMTNMDSIHS